MGGMGHKKPSGKPKKKADYMMNNDQEGFFDQDYGGFDNSAMNAFLPRDFRGFEFDDIDNKHTFLDLDDDFDEEDLK
eukprot:CAMPEP_0168336664 /NCGR_PEP_ID=MMETSP0213-20121227/11695_1 /TAXON_ID=151035 /ORGANISM="Euplotes harpa, Strain FSP1.4" /LENGTH=76 /DNA_ID=CAMNT_0008341937 /DNA_START=42 /DNA_END=272 /DNA_ORIENTATION=+